MRKIIVTLLVAIQTFGTVSSAQEGARWIRKNEISPDGKSIAFAYQGDIFTVAVEGGLARAITTNRAYDSDPHWTPDGKNIVFSSQREDYNRNVFVTSANGGNPVRVTKYSGNETPVGCLPDGRILFNANIQQDSRWGGFPGSAQLYCINRDGTGLKLVTSLTVNGISFGADGAVLYEDNKGYEDPFRKHHTSSVTRDVWLYKYDNPATEGTFTKMSTGYPGENRNPVFAADGHTYYYLSEQSGSFNIWKSDISTPGQSTQVSFFEKHPVRYLSIASDGTMAFSFNGDLYTMREGTDPKKLDITILEDTAVKETTTSSASASSATEFAVSPNGKEVAFITHGEVFVTTTMDFSNSKRITNTADRERGISFSDDGRVLYYASDRGGRWGIWKTSLQDSKDKYFTFAYDLKEERVTDEDQTCFQPAVSPDGKWLAFLRDRTDIVIKDTKNGKEKVLLEGVNYSYSDGDQSYAWSPDSRYILCNYFGLGGWHNQDVALIDIESGEITDLTESGYSDGAFKWALGGKAMTWESDKAGYRSHGSWGSEDDVYIMFFDAKAYYEFIRSKDSQEVEKFLASSDKKKKDEPKDSTSADSTSKKKTEKLSLDLENRADRTIRLTPSSGRMGDHIISPDGTKLYYMVKLENSTDLCSIDIKTGSVKVVSKGVSGRFYPSPDGKEAYLQTGGSLSKFDLNSGKTTRISGRSEYEYDPEKEREYIFNHTWQQVYEKFYDPEIHGVEWDMYRDNYKQFLPYVKNNYDFQELLSELLGELNGSHTGARYRDMTLATVLLGKSTASFGLLYDEKYDGDGLKIKEILPGSCLAAAYPDLKEGDIIEKIEEKPVRYDGQWYTALESLGGKRIKVCIRSGHKTEDVFIEPVSNSRDADMLYRRWVRQREDMVEKLSGGRIGYVHVKGMNSDSFREVYSKALGKYRNCDALIVDTRHNGGGWLHDDLATFLNGKEYIKFQPRGRYISSEPFNKWIKPSCVLIGEDNYSDACGFPYVYKTLGIGKLIGAPVPGTMTAVWWETQLDQSLVFGIPQVGSWAVKEQRYLENYQIEPDILVYNDPASVIRGEDRQLEAAVAEMLKEIDHEK